MHKRKFLSQIALLGLGLYLSHSALAADNQPQRKPDLADVAEGVYFGDVISDSQGSSQSGVTLTVTRIGKNLVQVTSSYGRLPVIEVPLTKAMNSIIQAKGDSPFVLDRTKSPAQLDVSFHNEVSWSGVRQ
ncbi:hypothetical protein [Methylomonas sp. AM2-LC]|uniref:hypothetical protein n=1 Tax=Methylomonas sp. AM2-LC TaxID=3153301 RepID=UPI003262D7F8